MRMFRDDWLIIRERHMNETLTKHTKLEARLPRITNISMAIHSSRAVISNTSAKRKVSLKSHRQMRELKLNAGIKRPSPMAIR